MAKVVQFIPDGCTLVFKNYYEIQTTDIRTFNVPTCIAKVAQCIPDGCPLFSNIVLKDVPTAFD